MKPLRGAAIVGLSIWIGAHGAEVDAQALRRIAILDDAAASVRGPYWAAFRERLSALGWTEGRNIAIDARYANDDRGRLDALAAEIVATKPDVFVVATTTVAVAARKATSEIPIVAIGVADPVGAGLVTSLARPGGNVTGASFNQAEIAGKWLNLVREMAPAAKSVAYLTDAGNPGEKLVFGELEVRARGTGLAVEYFDGVDPSNVEKAFAAVAAKRFDAVIVGTPSRMLANKEQIVGAAASGRVPTIYARREYVMAGGIVSYGTDFQPVFARAADYVNRILRGTRPADLPYEMASTFRLVVNPAAARRMNIALPSAIRVRADEVIE